MSQYKITRDEAWVIAAALEDWDTRFLDRVDSKEMLIKLMKVIKELTRRMTDQSSDGRRVGRSSRAHLGLIDSLKRLDTKYFGS